MIYNSLVKRGQRLFTTKTAVLFFLTILLICIALAYGNTALADNYIDDNEFFSYERFFLKKALIDELSVDGRLQKDVRDFTLIFTDGIYALSSGRLDKAKKDLLKAREIWPEYFYTEFLLGIVYETYGDYKLAARHYKSYLNRLKAFHQGQYRISEPLIKSLYAYDIEPYAIAHELIRSHLTIYGINLDKVRPTVIFPGFILPFFISTIIAAASAIAYFWLFPYFKKQDRIKNPPEGFWVCENCGTDNPELATECEKCRHPHKT
jgi:tetratricopeptide (TPR) repeat protein